MDDYEYWSYNDTARWIVNSGRKPRSHEAELARLDREMDKLAADFLQRYREGLDNAILGDKAPAVVADTKHIPNTLREMVEEGK